MPSEPSPDRPDLSPARRPRLTSVDLLRGTVMVLMVLDHTRDYFSDLSFEPTNLARATPALFMTRWITHFCAPVFAFLAGTGAYLASQSGRSRGELARFLITRGLWLVILEQTVEAFGLSFRPTFPVFLALVLWSIGWSFVVLGLLVAMGVPSRVIAAFGVAMMAVHNLADPFGVRPPAPVPVWLTILHQPGLLGQLPNGPALLAGYPLVPWVGVVMAGFGFGEVLGWEPRHRRRVMVGLAGVCITLFVLLRATNLYGDPRPWSRQASPLLNVLSFVNTLKYPPSLQFLLMTLGPAFGLLAVFDRVGADGPIRRGLVTLGRVPLFYYLLQWYVIHALAIAVAVLRGQPLGWLFPASPPVEPPPESQFGLPFVYIMWALVVAILYLASSWFAGLKERRRDLWWLAYL